MRATCTALLALLVIACDDGGWPSSFDAFPDSVPPDTSGDAAYETPGDPPADADAPADPASEPSSDPADEEPEPPSIPYCTERCGTSADCGNPAAPAFSSDNYACTGGFCIYTGCLSDLECQDTSGAGYGCDATMEVPYCAQTCATVSACGFPSMPAYTFDHYTCTGGYCRYTGCRTDAECRDTIGAEYGCDSSAAVPYCAETCATAADCGSPSTPAYSSDNYACRGGYCAYTGCVSDAECVESLGSDYGCMDT